MLADSKALSLETASDAELARRVAACAGETASEAELCRRFAPRIRLYGLRHLRDEERARDLVQSVLLVVLQALRAGRVDDLDRIDRFMLGTCRHLALKAHAVEARAEPTPADVLDVVAGAASGMEIERIDSEALYRCLSQLEPRSRTVVHLSFHREKSAQEIADVLGMTAGNVRVVRHRAIAQLRKCIDGPPTRGTDERRA